MLNDEDDEIRKVQAENLDLETVREIKYAVRGFSETEPSPTDLDEYRTGRHDAFSAVVGLLSRFEAEIEDSAGRDDSEV
jgi:hypothetical protein